MGWVSPYTGSGENWSDISKAYDNDEATTAWSFSETDGLVLNSRSTIYCDKVRIYALDYPGVDPNIYIELFYGGIWRSVYYGTIDRDKWVEIPLDFTVETDRVRITFNADGYRHQVYEFDFYSIVAPEVSTQEATNIEATTATGNGTVISTGDENPTRYIEWGTSPGNLPNHVSAGVGGVGPYTANLTELPPGTTIYFRARATNSAGTGYGVQKFFKTKSVAPEVETDACSDVKVTSFDANGDITDDGGDTITTRGFHYSKVFDDFEWGVFDAEERFEWGVDTDPLSDSGGTVMWTIIAGGDSKAEIDDEEGIPYSGTRCARLYRDGSNNPRAYFSQGAIDSSQILFARVRKDTNSDIALYYGHDGKVIQVYYDPNENLVYYDGSAHDTGVDIDVEEWATLAIKNVDWSAGTFDIYHNGILAKSGATMRTASSWNGTLSFYNRQGDSNAWLDEVVVGHVPLDDSGGAITWTITAAGASKVEIDTAQHYSGTRSARFYRDGTNNPSADFAQAPLTNGQVLSVWVRKDGTSRPMIYAGDGSKLINCGYDSDENLEWVDDGGAQDTDVDITVGSWALLEIKNVDWDAGTYDIYHNGILAKTGAVMRTHTGWNGIIRFYNLTGTSEAWLDNVAVWDVEDESDSYSEGEYSLEITGLDPATTYYVQAFAENAAGFGYGNVVSAETALIIEGSSEFSGIGTIESQAILVIPAQSEFSGVGTILSDSLVNVLGSGEFSGIGTITSSSYLFVIGQGQILGEGTITSNAYLFIVGQGEILGEGTILSSGLLDILGSSEFIGEGIITSNAYLVISGSGEILGIGAIDSSSHLFIIGQGEILGEGIVLSSGEIWYCRPSRVPISQMSIKRMPVGRISGSRIPTGRMPRKQIPVSRISVERVSSSQLPIERKDESELPPCRGTKR